MLASFLVVMSALPASGGVTWAELRAGLQLDAGSTGDAVAYSSHGGWLGGNAQLAFTVFGRKLKDDDTAPALQPFLQRAPRYQLEVSGGGISNRPTFLSGGAVASASFSEGTFATSLSANGYVRWLYLGGGFGLRYSNVHWENPGSFPAAANASEILINPWLVLGGRWRELLVFAGWGFVPYRYNSDPMRIRFWGGVFAGAHTVIRNFVDLGARIEVLDQGAVIEAGATVWLRRRFGISFGLEGGRGAYADSSTVFDRAGGQVALAYWLKPRVGLSLSYAPAWLRSVVDTGFFRPFELSSVQHLLTFGVTWRPEIRAQLPSLDDDEPMKR